MMAALDLSYLVCFQLVNGKSLPLQLRFEFSPERLRVVLEYAGMSSKNLGRQQVNLVLDRLERLLVGLGFSRGSPRPHLDSIQEKCNVHFLFRNLGRDRCDAICQRILVDIGAVYAIKDRFELLEGKFAVVDNRCQFGSIHVRGVVGIVEDGLRVAGLDAQVA